LFRAESLVAAQHFFNALWQLPDPAQLTSESNRRTFYWLLAGFGVIWMLPGTIHWLHYADWNQNPSAIRLHAWHGLLAGVLLFVSLKLLASGPSQSFIYFVF
jgi:hypothetical protein